MNLVIVESPAKAKTIEKYLGKDYKVLSSFGHVRDLPNKKIGVDVRNNYLPEYEIPAKAKKVVSEIKKAEENAKILYLATDLDREGEAISWHLIQALKLKDDAEKIKRITFSEITKEAVTDAIKNPRKINEDLVDAQQARRILDRLVGYKLSPLLWRKVKSGLSAGRVQSVAVRLIVEREKEIKKFKPDEYWVISVLLSKENDEIKFKAILIEQEGKPIAKLDIKNKTQSGEIIKKLKDAKYFVDDIKKSDLNRKPSAPFTTSTLQMEASRKLGFSAKQTMMLAQKLYEAGHITYMRTDSVNLSSGAITSIRKVIESEFGKKYLPDSSQSYQTKTKRAQEAHEAIRPTHFDEKVASSDEREQKLYSLIWKRAVASQMKEAIITIIEARIVAKVKEKFVFLARGESVKFEGFIKVYTESSDDEPAESQVATIPDLVKDESLLCHDLLNEQKFTEPPKRYSEASLVKKLESLGIGRPSTYAPTMSTIQDRGYVKLEEKKFFPEEIGVIVSDLLVEHFPKVVDYEFTAHMEDEFDEIAVGEKKWPDVIDEFYKPFAENLKEKTAELEKKDIIAVEKTNEKCPECGKMLVIRLGRFGKFVACPGYPECKYSKPLKTKDDHKAKVVGEDGEVEKLKEVEGEKCDKCKGRMILKEGKFGKFLACENYPKCKNTKTIVQATGIKCPDCNDGDVVERRTKKGRVFWGCSKYPGCKYASWNNPADGNDKVES